MFIEFCIISGGFIRFGCHRGVSAADPEILLHIASIYFNKTFSYCTKHEDLNGRGLPNKVNKLK